VNALAGLFQIRLATTSTRCLQVRLWVSKRSNLHRCAHI